MREHTLLLTTSDGTVFLGDLWLRNETSDGWRCECRTIEHTTASSYADTIQRMHGLNRKDKTTTTLGTSHYKCDGTWIPEFSSYEPAQGNSELSVKSPHGVIDLYGAKAAALR